MRIVNYVRIFSDSASLAGRKLDTTGSGKEMLTRLFHTLSVEYPKFFKMDVLCRLGFVASELLLNAEQGRFVQREDRTVLMFSSCGSFVNDNNYQKTISPEDYFPSPSLFVYTLPNIITGEICIRNQYLGNSTAFVLPHFDASQIISSIRTEFLDKETKSVLAGWVDCRSSDDFDALVMIIEDGDVPESDKVKLNINNLNNIFEDGTID